MTDVLSSRDSGRAMSADVLFAGVGHMRALCRAHDWAASALGPVDQWPVSLRTSAQMLLSLGEPALLLWGPDLVQLFNDAFRPSLELGDGDRDALGAPAADYWAEVWEVRGPEIARVLAGGPATVHADVRLEMTRAGRVQDVWWSYTDAPVFGDDGAVAGVLVICQDTTARVVAARDLAQREGSSEEANVRATRIREPVADEHLTMDADVGTLTVNAEAEQALRDLTDRYRVLFESVETGVAIIEMLVDADGRAVDYAFVDVNAAFVQQTGLVDAVGRTARALVPGLEAFWVDTYARVAETGESAHFEQGSAAMGRYFEVSAVRIGPAESRRVALLFRDVSAPRAAAAEREALLHSVAHERHQLQEVFRQAPAFLALLRGPQHVFEFANDAYCELVGQRELLGRTVLDAIPEVRHQGFVELLDGVLATGTPIVGRDVPVRLIQGPGASIDERFVDFTYTPMTTAEGARIGVIVHGVDVTEQVRSRERLADAEQQLRTLADAIPTLAWTARADGYIDWYNAQWYAYTGTTPADMEGWGWQSVHDPDVLPSVLDRWQSSIATGVPFEMTFPLRGADGVFQSFLTRVVPSRDASGAVVRWFGTNTNIESEQRLRRAAEAANRAKSEFLTVMSHELRTPLNAIDGYAELMELGIRGPITAEQREDLARIRKSEKHLLGLINGVLNYAQVEAGVVQYEMASVSVEEVLVTCEALTTPQALTRGLVLHREPSDPSLAVCADREKLQQVVLNLISNAIKFTNSGGRIALSCHRDGVGPRATVHIRVTDTGIGIAANQLSRVFEPFVQVDSELTRTRDGTGLGLAISRDLARGMGGDLTAESTLGEGSAFTLSMRVPFA